MANIINAVSGTGLTQSADGSGIIKVQSNGSTTNALAWVRFNGVTTVTIAEPKVAFKANATYVGGEPIASNTESKVNFTGTVFDESKIFEGIKTMSHMLSINPFPKA